MVELSNGKEIIINVGGLIPLIPTGIMVSCQNPENGKMVKHKCSVMKRKEWLEYLRGKAGGCILYLFFGHYTEMSVHGINETLSVFVSIYTLYPYKAGDENAVNSSMR